MKRLCFYLLGILVFFTTGLLYAQNGTVQGRVSDGITNDPLQGVNIQIIATGFSAITDLNGNYTITNIPPGSYSLQASHVDYQTSTASNILVLVSQTTIRNFVLVQPPSQIYTVTNTLFDAPGALKQAILDANANPGIDLLQFNIPGVGPHTIQPLSLPDSTLPEITDPVIIDGYTQTGATPATISTDAILKIELDGSIAGAGAYGLHITAGECIIRGLVIQNFSQTAIYIEDGVNNIIEGNFIGTDHSGTVAAQNGIGIDINASSTNTIGGNGERARNIISGNAAFAIRITAGATIPASGNIVQGNYIGTDVTGSALLQNGDDGVNIAFASGNVVKNNVLCGAGRGGVPNNGVEIYGDTASANIVQGNFIGTDYTGTITDPDGIPDNGDELGNDFFGISISDAPNNIIGGTTTAERNIISGNKQAGIIIEGTSASGNVIIGNYVGTNVNGTSALGNKQHGVHINGAPNNRIGGSTADSTNVISGNGYDGIEIGTTSATGNLVIGNFIGTNASGTDPMLNGGADIRINDAPGNIIGGTEAGSRNIFVHMDITNSGANNNYIVGNYIGIDVSGEEPLVASPSGSGIFVIHGHDNIIGPGNIISGNDIGVLLFDDGGGLTNTTANVIIGNFIGTNSNGTTAVANRVGVQIENAPNNTVGGLTPEDRNIVSGNDIGINIFGIDADNNDVLGNYVGTNISGTARIPNNNGVWITEGSDNIIGGSAQDARNIISGNNDNGIWIQGSPTSEASGNIIQGNYIGITPNGLDSLGNRGFGVKIREASGNIVGGSGEGEGNVISANGTLSPPRHGIHIEYDDSEIGNIVQGNLIGTDATGMFGRGNVNFGVMIFHASHSTILDNVVADNRYGVVIWGEEADFNSVQGNLIGTKVNGTEALGNELGLYIRRGHNNIVGGTSLEMRNIISGNERWGLIIGRGGASGNQVMGNYIGLDINGSNNPLGNGYAHPDLKGAGVDIFNASGNTIGGSDPGAANVISGNIGYGVLIDKDYENPITTENNLLQGNLIGTNPLGTEIIANTKIAVLFDSVETNTITGGIITGSDHGLYLYGGSRVIINGGTVFDSNTKTAISAVEASTLSIDGCTISNTIQNSGVELWDGSTASITNCTFTNNNMYPIQLSKNLAELPAGALTALSDNIFDEGEMIGIGGIQLDNIHLYNDGIPYLAIDDITVLADSSFFVDDGVTVKFPGLSRGMSIRGSLQATNATFTSAIPPTEEGGSYWQAIYFWPESYGLLDGCIVEYAASLVGQFHPDDPSYNVGAGGCIEILGTADVTINNTIVRNSNLYGVELRNSSPTLTGVTIEKSRHGLHAINASTPIVEDCQFISNVDIGVHLEDSSPTFNSCIFSDNYNVGIWSVNSGPTFIGGRIEKNVNQGIAIDGFPVPPTLNGIKVISGNGNWGVLNRTTVDINAQNIYWGDLSGPHDDSDADGQGRLNPDGKGDNVSEFVNWDPYLIPISQIQPQNPMPYRVNEIGNPSITDGSDITAIRNGFQNWEDVTSSNISFTDDGLSLLKNASASDGINLVTFCDEEFPFQYGVLAVAAKTIEVSDDGATGKIIDADIIFNPNWINHPEYKFGTSGGQNEFDIEGITTHEIGHVLGLVHSGVADATMFFALEPGEGARSFSADDIAWVSYLYPESDFNTLFGSISGNIQNGYNPGSPVAGVLVIAINEQTGESIHAYSDEDGNYLIPGVPPGDYKVFIQPLDGDVEGCRFTPGNVSAYIRMVTTITDFPNEFYNDSDGATDDPESFTLVSVNAGVSTTEIDLVTNFDVTYPEVVKVSPDINAIDIDVNTDIRITFSEIMDANSFNNSTFILNNGSNPVAGSITFREDNKVAVFKPESHLDIGAEYLVELSTDVTDVNGNSLIQVFNSNFTTEAPNVIPLTIEQIQLNKNTEGVFPTTKIVVIFSERIEPSTLTVSTDQIAGSFTLSPDEISNVDCSIAFSQENKVATFSPVAPLAEGTNYTITMTPAISDISGNSLESELFAFTTIPPIPPYVLNVGPASGATEVNLNTPVIVNFSEPINRASINPTTFMLKKGGDTIGGSYTFLMEDSRVVFNPMDILKYATTYTYELSQEIVDLAGSPLDAITSSQFTTKDAPNQTTIWSLYPNGGSAGTIVVIAGEGFDKTLANNVVSFNGVTAVVLDVSSNSLRTKVPIAATLGSGNVTVTANGNISNPWEFEVTEPVSDPVNDVVARATTESEGSDGASSLDGAYFYIANSGDNSVSVVDMNIDPPASIVSIQVGETPLKIAINPMGTLAYVTNFNSNTVSVIDINPNSATKNTVIETIEVGLNPWGIIVTADGTRVYVANYTSQDLYVIDANPESGAFNKVVARVNTDSENTDIDDSMDGLSLFVGGADALKILSIDKYGSKYKLEQYNTVVARVNTDSETKNVEGDMLDGLVVAITEDGNIIIIDGNPESPSFSKVVARVNTDSESKDAETLDGIIIYSSNYDTDNVFVFEIVYSTNSEAITSPIYASNVSLKHIDTIPVEDAPMGVVINPVTQRAVVVNSGSDNVSIIDISQSESDMVGEVSAPVEPVEMNSPITVSASFPDLDFSAGLSAVWKWGDGNTSQGIINESNSILVSGSHTYTTAGVFTITLRIVNEEGVSGISKFQFVVIYDPDGGFVTGGGWINSPEGAYIPDPSLTGKANFGFVAKYKKGANTPTGNTEFKFKVADLEFKSTSYEWLVIAGAKAKYKGEGTINGSGEYRFMLSAIDGQVNGGGGEDKFRIKIWDKDENNGGIVYDNQKGDADDSDATTVPGGGSIAIHNDKGKLKKDSGESDGETHDDKWLPEKYALFQNYPNPFNPETTIQFDIPINEEKGVHVKLNIYNILGQLICTLVDDEKMPGRYTIAWDGRYDSGLSAPNGLYMFKIKAGEFQKVNKMILIQ